MIGSPSFSYSTCWILKTNSRQPEKSGKEDQVTLLNVISMCCVEPTVKVDEPGRVMLTVVRDSPTDDEVRVKYKTADNVALAIDHDYTAILETLIIFRAQETEYSFEIEVIDDTLPETDESFYVLLYDPQGRFSVQLHIVLLNNWCWVGNKTIILV